MHCKMIVKCKLPLFFILDSVTDNSRYEIKTFEVQQNSVLHGFSGYFDTVLFKDITLSIQPSTRSPGMFSWFPIFFPIKVRQIFMIKI